MTRFAFGPIAATIAASTTFLDADWPASNVLDPLHPHIRAYSADIGSAHRLTLAFAAATQPHVVAIINANFLSLSVQQKNADTWGSPNYTQAITLAQSGNDRYHYALVPSIQFPGNPFLNQQYLSLSIPAQDTTDGATQFKLGIVYPGFLVSAPGDVRPGPDEEKVEAIEDVRTADGRRLERLVLDDPAWRYRAVRAADGEAELAAWRAIDAQWSAAPGQAALVLQRDAYPEECYVARKVSSRWRHDTFLSEGDLEFHEVTAG